jgi:murein DD-endopeptidase MepM/ murein hydrolase activator NlpD
MLTASRFAAVAAAAVVLVASPSPAQEDPRRARDQVRRERASLAGELDTLRASEGELLATLDALEDQVGRQAVALEAAKSAVRAAEVEMAAAGERVDVTRARVMVLTEALVDRAVESFMHPNSDPTFDEVVRSRDVAEAARKTALLGHVSATDDDVIDALDAAREDFELQEREAAAARARAASRRVETEGRLAALEQTREDTTVVRGAVRQRKRDVLAEIEEHEAAESWLTGVIREHERRAAAAEAARQAARRQETLAGGTTPPTGPSAGPQGSGGCLWPVDGVVTSEYGRRWGRLHAGIDIAAPSGTTIVAAAAGTVVFSGWQSGYGNVVILDHGGFATVYAHQSSRAVGEGQAIARGQAIGRVGSTGHSTGPHVHFETRYGGEPRNPRGCL